MTSRATQQDHTPELPGLVVDPSCVHSTLATLMRQRGVAEPAVLLGYPLGTRCRRDGQGWLCFDQLVPELVSRIHTVVPVTLHSVGVGAVPQVTGEEWVVFLVDAWGMPHLTENYHRSHSLHAVLALGRVPGAGHVAVADPQSGVAHRGLMPAAQLAAALRSGAVPTAVITMGKARGRGEKADPAEWLEVMRQQACDDTTYLSLRSLMDLLDRHTGQVCEEMLLLRTETRPPSAPAAKRPWRLIRGLWNVSTGLRWTALGWDTTPLVGHPLAERVRGPALQLASRWMVLHHLLLDHGRVGSTSSPRMRLDAVRASLRLLRTAHEQYVATLLVAQSRALGGC